MIIDEATKDKIRELILNTIRANFASGDTKATIPVLSLQYYLHDLQKAGLNQTIKSKRL